MCLIIVKQTGIDLPKEEYLRLGAKRNSDGLGLAYLKAGEQSVTLKKDFKDIDELVGYVKTNITKEDTLIVHFRLATHGLRDEGNRHPFPISKNKDLLRKTSLSCKYAMAHNGVLNQYSRIDDTELSDTQQFVLEVLSETAVKENLDKPGIKKLVSEFLGGDRLAIMNNKGKLWLFGTFVEEDGCKFSNTLFKPYKAPNYAGFYQRNNHWDYCGCNNFLNHDKNNQRKTDNKNKENEVRMTGICEGCGKDKKVKLQRYNNSDYQFCKRCRKKARKGKLQLNKWENGSLKNVLETSEEIDEFSCVSCKGYFKASELTLILGSYSVCPECLNEVKQDPQQSFIV